MSQEPNHTTHQPILVQVPTSDDVHVERPRLPTPSLWQPGVRVTHKTDPTREGVVRVVEYATRQFRLDGHPRVSWESFDNWNPLVEKTAEERAKDEAAEKLREEIKSLSGNDLLVAEAWLEDEDPVRALKKLAALKAAGVIKGKAGK